MLKFIKSLFKKQAVPASLRRLQTLERRCATSADLETIIVLLRQNTALNESLTQERALTKESRELIEIQNQQIARMRKNLDDACGTICQLRNKLTFAKEKLFHLGDDETFLERARFEANGMIDSVGGV